MDAPSAATLLERERQAWLPFEALGGLTDAELGQSVAAAHDWSARDLIAHLIAWLGDAIDVAHELTVGATSETRITSRQASRLVATRSTRRSRRRGAGFRSRRSGAGCTTCPSSFGGPRRPFPTRDGSRIRRTSGSSRSIRSATTRTTSTISARSSLRRQWAVRKA